MSDTRKQKRAAIQKELAALRRQDGSWEPEDVVDYAKANPDSELHSMFEWDDEAAALEHRLLTARHIITEYVVVYEKSSKEVVVAEIVSVPSLRKKGRGSYRAWPDVSANDAWRLECLEEQKAKLKTMCLEWRSRLPELERVWKAISSIK